jgi:DNA polymerase (family 10)
MDPLAIATCLRELALYKRLDGDAHRARAYDRAAGTVEAIHDLDRRLTANTLTELPNIGDSIAKLIAELARTGHAPVLDAARAKWPVTVVELAQLEGVGVVKARKLVEALEPEGLDELMAMAEAGKIRELPGFGEASEAKILAALRNRHVRGEQRLLEDARRLGASIAAYLAADPAVISAEPAGPARRWCEIVDRLVIVAVSRDPAAAVERFRRHGLIGSVASAGADRWIGKVTSDGGACELVVTDPEHAGAALIIATGSPAHVEGLRERAAAAGLDLARIAAPDEAGVYEALGLAWLPPEIRDGDDELVRAAAGETFADLVTLADLTGAFHCHTLYSDGKNTIEEMAAAAHARGLGLLTITDHSVSAGYAGGLSEERLRAQWLEIAEVQARTPVKLLRGVESDILADGSLDYPTPVLGELDVVIASVHMRHKLDRDGMTRRLVAAMRQPIFKIWGHALGRLVLRRDPIDLRFDEVLDAIAASPAAIEINGDPHRLDLDPVRARQARARGIKFVLSADAHATGQIAYLENAVAMARRARLRPADILNTRPPDEVAELVHPLRAARRPAPAA